MNQLNALSNRVEYYAPQQYDPPAILRYTLETKPWAILNLRFLVAAIAFCLEPLTIRRTWQLKNCCMLTGKQFG